MESYCSGCHKACGEKIQTDSIGYGAGGFNISRTLLVSYCCEAELETAKQNKRYWDEQEPEQI
jgi:hypothetical protein